MQRLTYHATMAINNNNYLESHIAVAAGLAPDLELATLEYIAELYDPEDNSSN